MIKQYKNVWLSILSALVLSVGSHTMAKDEAIDTNTMSEATESVEQNVKSETDKATTERREKILDEAVDALAKTKDALKALEEKRTDDALEALAVATGKLELIVAREPELAFATTDVSIVTRDLYGSTDAIQMAINRAKRELNDGNVQEARRILDELGSELVISVSSLPLATYPHAIKTITPLIDDGNIDEAKRSLQAALNTQIITDHVIPLPVLRAEALLERIEELAETANRSDAEDEELANKLAAARQHLEMGELLGYGENKTYDQLYAQLDDVRQKTEDGKSGTGFFDKLKNSMASLWNKTTERKHT